MKNPRAKQSRFPQILPEWLRDWAINCLDKEPLTQVLDDEADLLRDIKGGPEILQKLLADVPTATRLEAVYKRQSAKHGELEAKGRIRTFLVNVCLSACRVSEGRAALNETISDLQQIQKAARKLARMLSQQQQALGKAASLTYLQSRLSFESPPGFSRRRRGLRGMNHDGSELQQLLICLADDIGEEIAWLRQERAVRGQRKRTGKNANANDMIGSVCRHTKLLYVRLNYACTADIVAAITGQAVDVSRVEKLVKIRNKSRKKSGNLPGRK